MKPTYEELKKVIEWYADDKNWQWGIDEVLVKGVLGGKDKTTLVPTHYPEATVDRGELAREILRRIDMQPADPV